MNDGLTPKQLRKLLARQKQALAGEATSWRPKAYMLTPEESVEFMRKMREEYRAKLRRPKSGDEADAE